jgi:class 3 adenylate cyclase
MVRIPLVALSKSYLQRQTDRTLATLGRIVGRADVGMARVLPRVDSLAIHEGKRIQATVMFLDICGFSQRPSWTVEEQQLQLRVLSLFFTEMIRVIEDYSGFVEKNTGDGLMAYFVREATDTVSVKQRALACTLTMFSAAERQINPILRAASVPELEFRICLDSGPLTVAKVGAARGFNGIVAIGATANVASKMLGSAGPNTILIGSMMLDGIPMAWRERFVELQAVDTGWVFGPSMVPYTFWRYDGRWVEPTDD